MSLLPNNYDERLREKLQRIADKRGEDSTAAEELGNIKHTGAAPQKREKSVTEKAKDKQE